MEQRSIDFLKAQPNTAGPRTGRPCCPPAILQSPNELIVVKDLDRTAALLAGFARRVASETLSSRDAK